MTYSRPIHLLLSVGLAFFPSPSNTQNPQFSLGQLETSLNLTIFLCRNLSTFICLGGLLNSTFAQGKGPSWLGPPPGYLLKVLMDTLNRGHSGRVYEGSRTDCVTVAQPMCTRVSLI